jgi:drug/metabolite transporter (DMT)-like permease
MTAPAEARPVRWREETASFAATDWALFTAVVVIWGASFALIEISVRHLQPTLVATLRLAFGSATLALLPRARRPLPRSSWPSLALLGIVWMALPFSLFATAEQRINASLAGLLNGAAPLFTAVVAALAGRRRPSPRQSLGLAVGFTGVVAICWPTLRSTPSSIGGAALVLLATVCYGIAFNIAGPLERRYGPLPVIWRAQLVALTLEAPAGLAAIPDSSFAWRSLLAVAALGSLGTAIAFAAFTALAGRIGSTRASVSTYFVPVAAVALGAILLDEHVSSLALVGIPLVAASAAATSRDEGDRDPPKGRPSRPSALPAPVPHAQPATLGDLTQARKGGRPCTTSHSQPLTRSFCSPTTRPASWITSSRFRRATRSRPTSPGSCAPPCASVFR